MDTQALIAECITYEETARDTSDACDRHFWDGWDRELVRQGTPVALVTVTAPGLGKISIFTYHLCIALPNGTYASVREGQVERVSTSVAARRNGRDAYATRQVAKLYGPGIPVEYTAL